MNYKWRLHLFLGFYLIFAEGKVRRIVVDILNGNLDIGCAAELGISSVEGHHCKAHLLFFFPVQPSDGVDISKIVDLERLVGLAAQEAIPNPGILSRVSIHSLY